MAVIAAVNFVSGLVLLEDGRELPITGYYAACHDHNRGGRLEAGDILMSCCRVDTHDQSEVFTVDIPGSGGAALIVETGALNLAKPTDIN